MSDTEQEQKSIFASEEEVIQIGDKIKLIFETIKEIKELDETVAVVYMDSFVLAHNILTALGEGKQVDVSGQIELVSKALGYDLEDLVKHILMKNSNPKEPDEDTLKFITSNMDDYERFLAEAKSKDAIDFLKDNI